MVTARVLADPFGQVCCCRWKTRARALPEAERELVFQPFYRALGNEVDGSGLGLPIVREIARQHFATVSWRTPIRAKAAGHALHRALRCEPA